MGAVWFERRLDLGVQAEGVFLEHVGELAPGALGALVPPSATWSTDYAECLLVVDHPAFVRAGDRGTTTVQVNWAAGRLAGTWGTAALWDDDDPRDDDALLVQGVDITDHEAAATAVDWLARELARPVEHQIWTVRDRVVAQRWVTADTGRTLVSRGAPLARLGPPRYRSPTNSSAGVGDGD